jgi:hypothetical protein
VAQSINEGCKPDYVRLKVTKSRRCELPLLFFGTAPTLSRCHDVPMKGNNMTNQNQPGQQKQAPGQKPGQQQGGGPKPGQQSQAPGKGDRNPKEPLDQTSNTDT